ncbi:MAG: phytanoyl-CoA dioxygenase family protein, partial [Pyrinomonadaceae bacterium]
MHSDLSEFHHPLTDVFVATGDLPEAISDDDKQFFDEHGYLSGIKLLNDEQLSLLRKDLEVVMQPAFAGNSRFYEYHRNESVSSETTLFHALGAWRVSLAFHDLIFYPRFVSAASALLGGPIRFWHDQLFVKPPHDGGVVAWHQDYSYWTRTEPVAHLTCWIALDDSVVANGCVHYVPGSHKWNLLPRGELANNMESVLSLLTDQQKQAFRPIPVELKAGEASFHHPLMLHGSYENRSETPRRAAVINVFRDGVMSAT